jgi:hypothetical protein
LNNGHLLNAIILFSYYTSILTCSGRFLLACLQQQFWLCLLVYTVTRKEEKILHQIVVKIRYEVLSEECRILDSVIVCRINQPGLVLEGAPIERYMPWH